jgi:hypothetical protein
LYSRGFRLHRVLPTPNPLLSHCKLVGLHSSAERCLALIRFRFTRSFPLGRLTNA